MNSYSAAADINSRKTCNYERMPTKKFSPINTIYASTYL